MRALVILAALGLGASVAHAQSKPVPLAIGGIEVTGGSGALAGAVADAVRTGMGAANPGPKVAIATCVSAACLRDAAAAAGAERVLAVSVVVTGGEQDQYAITVTIADAEGRALRRRSKGCPTCAVLDATDHVTALVGEAIGAVVDDAVAVTVTTRPVAAPITIDGAEAGRSPWSGSLPAGPHRVAAGSVERDLFVEATGQPQAVELTLPVVASHRRRFGVITYATAGVGVAALAFGAVMIGKDGDPTCDHPSCPEVYDTATVGWIGAGLGVAALGAAGYMFWNDRRAERPVLAVVPTAGGAAAVAAGRF